MTTALIAGAGPVGLALAAELTRYGLDIRIIDKAPQRTDKSKALVVWPRTLELLDRTGVTPALIDTGFKMPAANIITGQHEDAKTIARIELGHIDSPYPFALMVPQSETERVLEEHLTQQGIKVERSTELLSFVENETTITSTLRHPDGHEETLDTAWLLACDGAHSTVRHQLAVPFTGSTLNTDWVLADLHLANVPHPGEVNVFWHAAGVLVVFPISPGRYRVIADTGETKPGIHRPDPTLDEIQAVLDQRSPGNILVSDPIWLAAFTINERKVADYRPAPRIFLLGDAAHIHSPAGGQGMNTGIQDACNLAWKLALVEKGLAAESLLDTYSIERSAIGDQVLADAGRLTTLAILRGELKQSLRNHIASLAFGLPFVRNTAADTITELSIGYPHSPLTATGKGERAPIRSGDQPFGAGDTPRFTLIAPGPIPPDLTDRFGTLFVPQVHGTASPTHHGDFHPNSITLVRPDGYIALTAPTGSWPKVTEYLARIAVTVKK